MVVPMVRMVLLILALLPSITIAQATDYWIDPNGNDANACTAVDSLEADPPISPGTYRKTIAGGQACMVGGDRLVIRAGTYTFASGGTGIINNPPSGSAGNYTTFMADPSGARPLISLNGAITQIGVYIVANSATGYTGSYVRIQGLEFTGAYYCLKTTYASGIPYFGDHQEWINNICRDTYETPMGVSYSTTPGQGTNHYVIRDSEFYNTGRYAADITTRTSGYNTIYGLGNNALIEGNTIHDAQHGIAIWGQVGTTNSVQSNNVIRNNRIYRMGRPDLNTWLGSSPVNVGSCIHQSTDGTGNQIYNNLCYDSGSAQISNFQGIHVRGVNSSQNTKVFNNTLYNIMAGHAIVNSLVYASTPLVEVRNNIEYLTPGNVTTGGGTFSNNLTTNPLFINASTGNFHLSAGSPAILYGLNESSVFTTDFDGYTRPASGAWDAGAFMYGGGVTADTTPPAAPTGLFVQ